MIFYMIYIYRFKTICFLNYARYFSSEWLNWQVEWGEASMLQAERLLLEEALKETLNQRFILLSDSCVPLYNFRYIYNYVMFCQKSFVDRYCTQSNESHSYLLNMFTVSC